MLPDWHSMALNPLPQTKVPLYWQAHCLGLPELLPPHLLRSARWPCDGATELAPNDLRGGVPLVCDLTGNTACRRQ
jgi:hypothetical protein